MAETKSIKAPVDAPVDAAATPAVPAAGDRVVMLSLRKDGTHDQHNPQLIGDKDAALAMTKRQFREQAVSAVDDVERRSFPSGDGETLEQDPAIAALKAKHDAAAADADTRAEAMVNALHESAGSNAS